MRTVKILVAIAIFSLIALQTFAQGGFPGDPGSGGGASAPLDGGILLALLAAGGFVTSLFAKKKKKDS